MFDIFIFIFGSSLASGFICLQERYLDKKRYLDKECYLDKRHYLDKRRYLDKGRDPYNDTDQYHDKDIDQRHDHHKDTDQFRYQDTGQRHHQRKETIIRLWCLPSRCNNCQQKIPWPNLLPLWGWVYSKGRCCHCRELLPLLYPLSELLGGLWALAVWWSSERSSVVLSGCFLLGMILLSILYYDLLFRRIPDFCVLLAASLGIGFGGEWINALITGSLIWLIRWLYRCLRHKEGLGLGDVKLIYALALWFPLQAVPSFLVGIGLSGLFWGQVWEYHVQEKVFPFAPALIFGFTFLFLFGVARFGNFGILSIVFN